MKKICNICKEEKDYTEFSIDKRTSTGRYSPCKKCFYNKYKKPYSSDEYYTGTTRSYYLTIGGRIKYLFDKMKYRSKKHNENGRIGFEVISYSKDDFEKHLLKNTNYKKVYEKWIENGMKYKDTPTIDRIDNLKGYQLENVQCLSFADNRMKQIKDLGHQVRKV